MTDYFKESLVKTVNVNGIVYDFNMSDTVKIDTSDLNNELVEHSQKFAWISTAYELACDQELKLKTRLERLYAQLDVLVRHEFDAHNVKITETKVANEVILRSEYTAAQDEYGASKLEASLLKVARDSMLHRREMLLALAHNYRAEGFSEISLKTDQYKAARNNG